MKKIKRIGYTPLNKCFKLSSKITFLQRKGKKSFTEKAHLKDLYTLLLAMINEHQTKALGKILKWISQ